MAIHRRDKVMIALDSFRDSGGVGIVSASATPKRFRAMRRSLNVRGPSNADPEAAATGTTQHVVARRRILETCILPGAHEHD